MPRLMEFASFSFVAWLAIKSTVVLAMAWLVRRVLAKQSAAVRHAVWITLFVSLAALLVFSLTVPALDVKLPANGPMPSTLLSSTARTVILPTTAADPAGPLYSVSPSHKAPMPWWRGIEWPSVVVLLWALGFVATSLPVLAGWLRMARMRRAALPIASSDLASLARQHGLAAPPALLEGPPGSMPMTFGIFRPAIFLPRDAREWDDQRRRAVLLHEFAHVRRGDSATQLASRVIVSFYWWNPLAWAAWREFVKEREQAADDLVLDAGTRAADYAQYLLEIARSERPAIGLSATAVAMARRSQLEGRLLAILDGRAKRTPASPRAIVLASVLALALVLPLAAMRMAPAPEQPPMQALLISLTTEMPSNLDALISKARLEKQPPAQLDVIADKASALGKFDAAEKLLEASLQLRAAASGENSPEYGVGLKRLADVYREEGKNAKAKEYYLRATELLGTADEIARVYIRLGTVELAMAGDDARKGKAEVAYQEYTDAANYFDQARRSSDAFDAEATMWQAIVARWQKDSAKARQLFQSALSKQTQHPSDFQPVAPLYYDYLDQNGQPDEAKQAHILAAGAMESAERNRQLLMDNTNGEKALRIGGSVLPPSIIHKVEPRYSTEARLAKFQGTAVAAVEIGADGVVHKLAIIRHLGLGLDEKAAEAIMQWRFKPAQQNGEPVASMATIEVNFRLL